jgi:predicted RNA methylase
MAATSNTSTAPALKSAWSCKKLPLVELLRVRIRSLEDWWFDSTRGIDTAGNAKTPAGSSVVGNTYDGYGYLPARVANMRDALRRLPIAYLPGYTFIDIGSGKGRMLFVAAEFSFARVTGVEFDENLHAAAVRNAATCRHWRRRCGVIEPVLANAANYEFPPDRLVIYLFNPFGPEIMHRMLDNLERSFTQHPRHIVLMMLWPEHADVVAQRSWLRQTERTRRHCIFEAGSETRGA